MAQIDGDVRESWRENPNRTFDLIIRVNGDVEARAEELQERGVKVKRRYRLTNSISAAASGEVALKLARVGWITRIECDRPVRAIRRS
jgi:hypothetical protein